MDGGDEDYDNGRACLKAGEFSHDTTVSTGVRGVVGGDDAGGGG
jgi:hypothetical protein